MQHKISDQVQLYCVVSPCILFNVTLIVNTYTTFTNLTYRGLNASSALLLILSLMTFLFL